MARDGILWKHGAFDVHFQTKSCAATFQSEWNFIGFEVFYVRVSLLMKRKSPQNLCESMANQKVAAHPRMKIDTKSAATVTLYTVLWNINYNNSSISYCREDKTFPSPKIPLISLNLIRWFSNFWLDMFFARTATRPFLLSASICDSPKNGMK